MRISWFRLRDRVTCRADRSWGDSSVPGGAYVQRRLEMIQFWVFWDFISSEVGKFARNGLSGLVVGYLGVFWAEEDQLLVVGSLQRKRKSRRFFSFRKIKEIYRHKESIEAFKVEIWKALRRYLLFLVAGVLCWVRQMLDGSRSSYQFTIAENTRKT